MEHPIPIEQLPPQVAKLCGPNAPRQMKKMTASGEAPVGPIDLITALYVLAYDKAQGFSEQAGNSLRNLPERMLQGTLDQLANPAVIDGISRLLIKRPEALNRILLNRAVTNETVEWITAKATDEKVLETVASNEQRLLTFPKIIEALYNNKASRMSTADRVVELAVRNGIALTGIACYEEVKASIEGRSISKPTEEATDEDHFFQKNMNREEWKELDDELLFKQNLERDKWKDLDDDDIDEALHKQEKTEAPKEEEKKIQSVEASLAQLNVSAKIRLATLGTSAQRAVLIRETNKLVSMAVVKAPTLSDSEKQQYSRYRTLSQEALRYIAREKEWIKHYTVKLNLVQNPRTPIEFSLRLLNFIRPHDLTSLQRDKNVPQAIARAAKNLQSKRTG
jgi:hypothetical protein